MRARLCALLALYLLAAPVSAQGPAAYKVLIPNVAPWQMENRQEKAGIHVELLRAIETTSRLHFAITPVVYARMAHELKAGATDFAIGVDSPQMNEAGQKIGMVLKTQTIILSSKRLAITDLADLHGKVLGIVRGAWYSDRISADAQINKHVVATIDQGVRMVAAGRIDALIGTKLAIAYAISSGGKPAGTFATPYEFAPIEFALYARAGMSQEIVDRLRSSLARLDESKERESIVARYTEGAFGAGLK